MYLFIVASFEIFAAGGPPNIRSEVDPSVTASLAYPITLILELEARHGLATERADITADLDSAADIGD